MTGRRSRAWLVPACAVLVGVGLASCSDEQSGVMTAPDVACDADKSSDDAKTIVEQVGGLVTEDYTVRFTHSTRVGVIALVDRNVPRAFQELRDDYGVIAVARLDEDRDPGTISGFSQIDEIVNDICAS